MLLQNLVAHLNDVVSVKSSKRTPCCSRAHAYGVRVDFNLKHTDLLFIGDYLFNTKTPRSIIITLKETITDLITLKQDTEKESQNHTMDNIMLKNIEPEL